MNNIDSTPLYQQAFFNTAKLLVPHYIGLGTSFLVSRVAHNIFKCEADSQTSQIIKFGAMVAGIAAGIYASSYVPLAVFTLTVGLKIAAISFVATLVTGVAIEALGVPNHLNPGIVVLSAAIGGVFPRFAPVLQAFSAVGLGAPLGANNKASAPVS